nr:hypothetical protein [uncultured Sphingomonas sp.]
MVNRDLPPGYLEAGAEYDRGLRELGLRVDALLWGAFGPDETLGLAFVWSGVERFGPLSVAKILFEAYSASALTREIDPFLVQILSPTFGLGLAITRIPASPEPHRFHDISRRGGHPRQPEKLLQFYEHWVYQRATRARSYFDVQRDWSRFQQRVRAAA